MMMGSVFAVSDINAVKTLLLDPKVLVNTQEMEGSTALMISAIRRLYFESGLYWLQVELATNSIKSHNFLRQNHMQQVCCKK
ncbi:hypothetical protein BN59_02104 [Legionella massiliensis]|uniref:Uncharacterized protein n=1 Tax=Legionella massiliensis TaxID=1034943 RepID=A0A078L1A0_9GAMM|nr:hypothetical protein [Legionella massiliensis]CDZ77814.1 hypothetical protein BN59_02104 [Legionella massiliensis]CEE13552.1 hypothetical protein BN1094_02104 [Legionella massiliensis]